MAVAVAPDGTTVASWSRSEGSGLVVEAARRLPGQAFGAPVMLSDPDNLASVPQVGIDAAGNATVVWQETDPVAPLRVRAARLPAGAGSFEQAQTLSSGAVAFAPAIGVGPNGTAVVVFGQGAAPNTVMKAAIRDGAGGLFGNAQPISDASENFYATNHTSVGDVVVAPDGSAVVAWATLGGGRYLLQTNERAPNGTFSPTGTTRSPTSANASGEQPAATIDPAGRVTVAWTQIADNTNPSSPKEIRSIARPPGGGFGSFAVASEPGVVADAPDLAAAADGTVIGAWVTGTGSDRHVEAAIRAPGATGFGQHAPLSPAGTGFAEPTVAANAAGDAIVLWPDFDTSAIVAARRPAGSTFGAPLEPVNDSGEPGGTQFIFNNAALAIDDQGNGTAFWRFDHFRSGSHFYRVQAAGFDAAPPTLSAAVPPTATAGAPVGMAAAALDRWGPVSLQLGVRRRRGRRGRRGLARVRRRGRFPGDRHRDRRRRQRRERDAPDRGRRPAAAADRLLGLQPLGLRPAQALHLPAPAAGQGAAARRGRGAALQGAPVPVQAQARHAYPQEPHRRLQGAVPAAAPLPARSDAAASHHRAGPHRQGRQVQAAQGQDPERADALPPARREQAAEDLLTGLHRNSGPDAMLPPP